MESKRPVTLNDCSVDLEGMFISVLYKKETGNNVPIIPRKEVCDNFLSDYKPNPYYELEKKHYNEYQLWLGEKIKEVIEGD